jgi:hypothetical protein
MALRKNRNLNQASEEPGTYHSLPPERTKMVTYVGFREMEATSGIVR